MTIRPFGQTGGSANTAAPRIKVNGPDCPKINLVSPMRNGQVLTGRSAATVVVTTSNNKEEMKNRENLLKKPDVEFADPVKTKVAEVEKITSFSDPVPASKKIETVREEAETAKPAAVSSKAAVLQSSKVASGRIESEKPAASNRITLTRKPPVWREKPRIPIKPQSVAQPTVEPVPSALYPAAAPELATEIPVQQMKVQKGECQPGQISIRFVHLSSGDAQDNSAKPAVVPPLVPAAKVDKELSALQRLDLLESTAGTATLPDRPSPSPSPVLKVPEVSLPHSEKSAAADVVDAPRSPSPVVAPIEINNNPIKAEPDNKVRTLPDQPTEQPRSPRTPEGPKETIKIESFSSDSRSSSTRGLTRSAFEALRANLAGTLELSRVCQPNRASVNNTKRQAPPTPDDSSSTDPPEPAVPPSPPPAPPTPPPPPPLEIPPAKAESPVEVVKPADRAISASPRYRNSFICTSPEGSVATDDYPRSVSLTRVERTDSQSMATKPPSIRKMLKERATHFLQMADSSGSCGGGSSGSRLSRSERFAVENGGGGGGTVSGKKGKGRFSLRKFLGLKKDGGWDEPAEPLPPKIRPEIVHPIDFHPVGQVQVVQGKVDSTTDMGRSPAHDSISSTDSGRHSDLQRSDSSVGGSSDCPSPANSHQSSSLKRGSLKGKIIDYFGR